MAATIGTAGCSVTAFVQDTSATLGSITSVISSSDIATVTTGSAHGLKVGMYVNVTVQQLTLLTVYIRLHLFQVQRLLHMQNLVHQMVRRTVQF